MHNVVVRVALLSLTLLVLGAGPVAAHASLIGTVPEDGSTLSEPPTGLTFRFNENIGNPAFVAVTAPDGSQLDVTGVRAVDSTVTATVQGADQKGRYTASYRVVSADGHPVEGTIHFDSTTGREVVQADAPAQESFVHRHGTHLVWGAIAAIVAVVLLLAPLRRPHDEG